MTLELIKIAIVVAIFGIAFFAAREAYLGHFSPTELALLVFTATLAMASHTIGALSYWLTEYLK